MSTSGSGPSIEPMLRARANPSYSDHQQRHHARFQSSPTNASQPKDDFLHFLTHLGHIASTPIRVPLDLMKKALTSPLTISLILKLTLMGFLALGSAIFSILAVGAFWWSWGTGGVVEMEGWLTYGSRVHRTPHALIPLSVSSFQEDLRYDVEVEMELVRPNRASEDISNFMLSLELRSQRNPEIILISAAQPSLPPPPLLTSLIPANPIPCIIPYPFRFLCPSRLIGRISPTRRISHRKSKGSSNPAASSFRASDIVLLSKQLMEGVVLVPAAGGNGVVGGAFVSIGREDTFNDSGEKCASPREVRTTGWVSIRFTPRPTGIRWLLSSHPLPPLLLLPPISLTLTLSSSLFAFLIISYVSRSTKKIDNGKKSEASRGKTTEEKLLDQRRSFAEQDREDRREEERLRAEWTQVEERAGGLRRIPEEKKRSRVESTIVGGSETTLSQPSTMPTFTGNPESSEDGASTSTETDTETATERAGSGGGAGVSMARRGSSDGSDGWVEAR